MHRLLKIITVFMVSAAIQLPRAGAAEGPIRVLFLGHESEHHPSNLYYPMLAKALGRDAIYFDYVTAVEEALGDAAYLARFDAVLLYANHSRIEPHQWRNLKRFVEQGGGFVPVHCASWCFQNEPGFDQLVGARFKSHQTGVFTPRTVRPDHEAIRGVPPLKAWDETYYHTRHNPQNRTVLQVRDPLPGDPHTEPEPWTWVRLQGKGRVFYTASGHDERVWARPEFHALLKHGILWAVGDARRTQYEQFLADRTPLTYEVRGDIPNYEKRPQPLRYQHPLSPAESMKYTQVPVDFRLELFASEPDVVNPICLAWDERGRLWVAEAVDYPNELAPGRHGHDRIKILEDTDGDGRCDRVTVFADGLNIPTSLTFANGGVIVAQAPDFLFFKDTNGDDRADVRRVLFSGWGVNDTHAGPSHLRYGFDNAIWGSVGYARFTGELGGRQHNFGSGIFRFSRDLSTMQFIGQFNNNTWGLGFNEAGDVFGSTANANPSFFCGLPAWLYEGGPPGMSAKMIADTAVFHPITPNIRQVDAFGQYTAGAGHTLATSAAFPPSYRNQIAFVCGPTGDLIGRFRITPRGAGYAAKNSFAFVASADEWFSPVAVEIGPDGNLWFADWYNFIIQHNPTPNPNRGGYQAKTGKGNAHINPNRDRQHGRIYRVIWEGAPPPKRTSLAGASPAELVQALGDDNLFWRLTAQRLLVTSRPEGVAPALRRQVVEGGPAAIHALWTLKGMEQLDDQIHQAALLSPNPALKRNAIQALGAATNDVRLFFDTAVVADSDPQVRRVAFAKMAEFPPSELAQRAAIRLLHDPANRDDEWLSLALRLVLRKQGAGGMTSLGENLLPNSSFEKNTDGQPVGWQVRTYRDQGDTEHTLAGPDAASQDGQFAMRIRSGGGADTSWFAPVTLTPDTDYRLSAWIKTRGVKGAAGALLNVHELGRAAATPAVTGNHDWTEVKVNFNSGNHTKVTVNLLFGGWGVSQGEAWYDDAQLRPVVLVGEGDPAKLSGDRERGRKLFHESGIASCIRCHHVGTEGGFVGPYLDDIGARKDKAYILQSLMDPQAAMAEGYPAEVSPMPPFGVLLAPQEIADLVAYLLTLRTPPDPATIKKPEPISYE